MTIPSLAQGVRMRVTENSSGRIFMDEYDWTIAVMRK